MIMNQCDKCGKVFEPYSPEHSSMTKLRWDGRRFSLAIIVKDEDGVSDAHLCPGCIKLAVADWQPKEAA